MTTPPRREIPDQDLKNSASTPKPASQELGASASSEQRGALRARQPEQKVLAAFGSPAPEARKILTAIAQIEAVRAAHPDREVEVVISTQAAFVLNLGFSPEESIDTESLQVALDENAQRLAEDSGPWCNLAEAGDIIEMSDANTGERLWEPPAVPATLAEPVVTPAVSLSGLMRIAKDGDPGIVAGVPTLLKDYRDSPEEIGRAHV